MKPIQLLLLGTGAAASAITATTSSTLSCDRVALSSESSTKWTVGCISSTTTTSTASFNPLLVLNFYVNNGVYVAASSSDLELSSTFSEVDELVSSSVTSFSLLAAADFTPNVPVTIVPTAFAQLSALQTLHLEGIPLAESKLHLVLPTSIEKISIVDCGVSNILLEFADGSALSDSALTFIDFRLNDLKSIPASIYDLPIAVSTINLQNNAMNLTSETTAHKKKVTAWIDADVLQLDSSSLATLETTSSVAKAADNDTQSQLDDALIISSSGSEENVSAKQGSSNMNAIPITILAIVIPAVLAIGIALAFVVRKRRRMQDRESVGILDLPHHYDKLTRDRSETSGHFTAIESELSRSRMSSGDDPHQESNGNGSCVALAVTPSDANQQQQHSTTGSAGYVNLESPHENENLSLSNAKRQVSHRDDGDSNHSLELLRTHSTASATPALERIAARKALKSALETLILNESEATTMLTVNANQYSFNSGTPIEETSSAFFIDCRHVCRLSEDETSEAAPPAQLVLKVFTEEDADLAGRESYALSCLQHDASTSDFVPRLFDDALEYELELKSSKNSNDIVKLSCCILVLEKPSCTTLGAHIAASREPLTQHIGRVVKALHALHARGLVHGALNSESLVVCAPNAQFKFWGLEHATRAGHKVPCPDDELLSVSQAQCVPPELASLTLEQKPRSRASAALDVWSLGVIILKMHAPRHQLEEFKGCSTSRNVFVRLTASDLDGELTNTCYFERSISQFVPNNDMQELLRRCLQRNPSSRPSVDFVSKHKSFQTTEREVSRATTVRSAAVPRLLSAIIEEKDSIVTSGEPEREASGKDQVPSKIVRVKTSERVNSEENDPELLPPSLWLFVPPIELQAAQAQTSISVDQWVIKLKKLQQQRAEELRFPLIFMCESCEPSATAPCSISTTTKCGASVPSSLLPLVMPLVRETMLFLEARALLSNGLGVGEANGLTGPQQWEELRTFYRALERMELATVNPVNEVELAPMEQQLKARDPSIARNVLDVLTAIILSEEKREYVRNLLDVFVSDETTEARAERSSWADLRPCEVRDQNSISTRWLCSHHTP